MTLRGILTIFLCVVATTASGCFEPPATYTGYELEQVAHLIWAHPYPHLLVHVDYAPEREPDPDALDHVMRLLDEVTDKDDITLTLNPLPDNADTRDANKEWTLDELIALHEAAEAEPRPKTYALLHIAYLNGNTTKNDRELGGAYYAESVFIFPDAVNKLFTGASPTLPVQKPGYKLAEKYVLVHEVGHALGLVNSGVEMIHDRESPKGSGHSKYPSSPMYMYDRSDLAFFDPERAPDRFDKYDLEDLAAFREIGRRAAPR